MSPSCIESLGTGCDRCEGVSLSLYLLLQGFSMIFSKDKDLHTQHLQQVFERLRRAGLYAKPSRCTFNAHELIP